MKKILSISIICMLVLNLMMFFYPNRIIAKSDYIEVVSEKYIQAAENVTSVSKVSIVIYYIIIPIIFLVFLIYKMLKK